MCEGADICPGTGKSINQAPCRVAKNFMPETEDVLTGVWGEMQELMELEDASKKGLNGYQMMNL